MPCLLTDAVVPLSAYSVQQQFVNNPNDTDWSRGPSYSAIVPSLLRRKLDDFIPHTFTQGEPFQTNFSLFGPYRIGSAYSRNDTYGAKPRAVKAVPSFVYRNYDLGTSCDVADITLDMIFSPAYNVGNVLGARVR
jgi:hypothetical protein